MVVAERLAYGTTLPNSMCVQCMPCAWCLSLLRFLPSPQTNTVEWNNFMCLSCVCLMVNKWHHAIVCHSSNWPAKMRIMRPRCFFFFYLRISGFTRYIWEHAMGDWMKSQWWGQCDKEICKRRCANWCRYFQRLMLTHYPRKKKTIKYMYYIKIKMETRDNWSCWLSENDRWLLWMNCELNSFISIWTGDRTLWEWD